MTDLTEIPDNLPARKITPALSPDLKSLLVDEANDSWAVRRIADDPQLRAEAICNLPVLKAAATQPAGREGVMEVIGKRFALYPQPNRSEGEWAAWWADYVEVLAGVPWHALEAGMAEYVKNPTSEFMPKPGKLRELAMTTPARVALAYGRAKRVAELSAPVKREPLPDFEMPEVAVKTMAAEYEQMARRPVPVYSKEALPSTAGKPDEGGLTPAMRALMARRSGEGQ